MKWPIEVADEEVEWPTVMAEEARARLRVAWKKVRGRFDHYFGGPEVGAGVKNESTKLLPDTEAQSKDAKPAAES